MMRKKNPPAIIVKFTLKSTKEIYIFGFRIVPELGKGDNMTFIYGAVLVSIKCYVGLEAGCPLVDITFNLEVINL